MVNVRFLRNQLAGPSWVRILRLSGSRADYLRACAGMGAVFMVSEVLKIVYRLPPHISVLTSFFLMIGVCYAYQRCFDDAIRTAALATVSYSVLSPVIYGRSPVSEFMDLIGLIAALCIAALAVHGIATKGRANAGT